MLGLVLTAGGARGAYQAGVLFDSYYTRALVQIGYRDAGERIDEIEAFLCRGQRKGATLSPPAEREPAHAEVG